MLYNVGEWEFRNRHVIIRSPCCMKRPESQTGEVQYYKQGIKDVSLWRCPLCDSIFVTYDPLYKQVLPVREDHYWSDLWVFDEELYWLLTERNR